MDFSHMIYKILRYLSTAMLLYLSMVGAKNIFFNDEDAIFLIKALVYGIFCLAPLMILFFGLGASDVDIPHKTECDESEESS